MQTDPTLTQWPELDADRLACEWGIPGVYLLHEVTSTNDLARSFALGGAPHGTVILAERQSAGRGRSGGRWESPPGLGVWMSMVVRPSRIPNPALLPLLVGAAAAAALDPYLGPVPAGFGVGLKWPNDLWTGDRKLGGVLCEAVWDHGAPSFVVVGVGINVLHTADDFPSGLRAGATSLRLQSGVAADRAAVAGSLARALVSSAGDVGEELDGPWLDAWTRRDVLRGRWVTIQPPRGPSVSGTALGVSPDGRLLLRTLDGVLRRIGSGSVRTGNG